MRKIGAATLLLALCFISGCDVATPFRGSGYQSEAGVTIGEGDELIVAITNAELSEDDQLRSVFWGYVKKVERSLDGRSGFVGYSKRAELLGSEVWTMTVWTDKASLEAFVRSDEHQAAIREALPALSSVRFARFEVGRAEIPVSWERALTELERASAEKD